MKTLKLNAIKFGVAWAIVFAVCVFLTTLAAMIWSGYATSFVNFFVGIYGFLGYQVSFIGAILGAIYAFIDTFIMTWIFALIYNKL